MRHMLLARCRAWLAVGLFLLGMHAMTTRSAAALDFAHGPWALRFDDSTGALTSLACRGTVLARADGAVPTVLFAIGPADRPVWLDALKLTPRLVDHATPAPGQLVLTIEAGDYQLVETYTLQDDPPRLDRALRLTNRGSATVKLRGVAFRTPGISTTTDGFARFPGTWPPQSYPFAAMQQGRVRWGGTSIAPALLQLTPARTLLFATKSQDTPDVLFVEGDGTCEMRQQIHAEGYLRPNVPQDIGTVCLQIVDADYWHALPALWSWMASVGIATPADQPAWVHTGVLYGFHPGGTIGSDWKDLGGFEAATQRLLPALPRLGVTALWVLPIEQQSPYWPRDYYRLMAGIGTPEQYKQMVARAHALKLYVLQDLVPHGGSPQGVYNLAHPEFMLQQENGKHFDYWLNDFNWPQWQDYIADVARYNIRTYDVDGYRVDAVGGSKAPNWNPAIPYARASLAQLEGGLGMLAKIRAAVKELKPQDGAVLAEVSPSARHAAVSDAEYDFTLCYTALHDWARMPAATFAADLQDFFEEQKYTLPPGAVLLRHVESHDSLRGQLWYGVSGLHAMYALTAWIEGLPLMYQDMDLGQAEPLAAINAQRHARPELGLGTADYRAVQCDTPGVFTCLRSYQGKQSVVAINFGRDAVHATLRWPGGTGTVDLAPLGYTLLPPPAPATPPPGIPTTMAAGHDVALPAVLPLTGAHEWFVDTLEGRLRDDCTVTRTGPATGSAAIYWRPPIHGLLWRHDATPLSPAMPRVGWRTADGTWHILTIDHAPESLHLAEWSGDQAGLFVLGGNGAHATQTDSTVIPPAPDPTQPIQLGGVTLRVVGPEYIVANGHYTVRLERQGGVIRMLRAGTRTMLLGHDLYGDQERFAVREASSINAGNDVEAGIRVWTDDAGLHLRFDGQLRGFTRFALLRPPVWYRNEYVFSAAPSFRNTWAFKSDAPVKDQTAFLAFHLPGTDADACRYLTGHAAASDQPLIAAAGRRAVVQGPTLPDTVVFLHQGQPLLTLSQIAAPATPPAHLFFDGRSFFLTLLDGNQMSLAADRWYKFSATWTPGATPQ